MKEETANSQQSERERAELALLHHIRARMPELQSLRHDCSDHWTYEDPVYRYFLEMVCKYGQQLDSPPQTLPSGWASVLCLYELR